GPAAAALGPRHPRQGVRGGTARWQARHYDRNRRHQLHCADGARRQSPRPHVDRERCQRGRRAAAGTVTAPAGQGHRDRPDHHPFCPGRRATARGGAALQQHHFRGDPGGSGPHRACADDGQDPRRAAQRRGPGDGSARESNHPDGHAGFLPHQEEKGRGRGRGRRDRGIHHRRQGQRRRRRAGPEHQRQHAGHGGSPRGARRSRGRYCRTHAGSNDRPGRRKFSVSLRARRKRSGARLREIAMNLLTGKTLMQPSRFLILLAALLGGLQIAGISGAAEPSASPTTEISLYIGEVKTLPVTRIQRIAIGNGKLITTNVLEKELLLLGETPGRTSMMIWTTDGKELKYTVNVVANDISDTQRRLSQLLVNMPGIKVDRVGQHVVVTGNASKLDLSRIASIAALFPQALNMVREEEVTMKRMVYLKLQIVEMKKS